jgi:hypothetical protein
MTDWRRAKSNNGPVLCKVIHPQAHDKYRVVLKNDVRGAGARREIRAPCAIGVTISVYAKHLCALASDRW